MAKATESRTERTINLELSEREAEFIYYVVGSCVIGDSHDGPRQHSDAIYYALSKLRLNTLAIRQAKLSSGQLNFGKFKPAVTVGER